MSGRQRDALGIVVLVIMVLAFSAGAGASWADRQGVSVAAGLRNDQLNRNALTLISEARGAVLVRDPGLIFFGDLAEGSY
jgi:hypothetical protein